MAKQNPRATRPERVPPAKSPAPQTAAQAIDAKIAALNDWRGETLGRVRALIREADPGVVEEVKWRGVPVFSHDGIICTGETYKSAVKLTFAKGALLDDPAGLFNASLGGNTRRAIDLHQGARLNATAFKALIRAAVALNSANKSAKKAAKKAAKTAAEPAKAKIATGKVKLLAGGNPQIAKAEGEAPVAAYIAALPGWKRAAAQRLDALIVRTLPQVRKAVKWNSPFYGVAGQGWFLSLHSFTHYLKLTFFQGAALRPPPPGASKMKDVRYLDLRESDVWDEAQIAAWIRQAAALPGYLG